ncbi:MAG TPA: calcium-binding protein [Alphaproteobacteria bacterium]|nr:calcium-binding protein [Alphaproteobacteria bacterium]
MATGTDGSETLNGTEGNDEIFGRLGDDTIFGLGGDDNLGGESGNDEIHGGAGNDLIVGGDDFEDNTSVGDDTLYGGDGNDSIFGSINADLIHGDAGDDFINSGSGNDTLHGGAGRDTFRYNAFRGIDLIADFTQGQDEIFIHRDDSHSIDFIGTRAFEPRVDRNGDGIPDGADYQVRYTHSNGETIVEADESGDGVADLTIRLTGEIELTAADFRNAVDRTRPTTQGTAGKDSIKGTEGADSIVAGLGDDTVEGRGGDDRIHGDLPVDPFEATNTGGRDRIKAGAGNDTVDGGAGNDTLYGEAGDDVLIGGEFVQNGDEISESRGGRDTLYGGDGNDRLFGGGEADKLYGDAGNDTLNGGLGRDTLKGGSGRDTFAFLDPTDADRIEDFKQGEDILEFRIEDASSVDFIGTAAFGAFTGRTAEMVARYAVRDGNTLVEVDRNGDGVADIVVELKGKVAVKASDIFNAFDRTGDVAGGAGGPAGTGRSETIEGGDAAERIAAGGGNDKVYADKGNDTVFGGEAGPADGPIFETGGGRDTLYGGEGNDQLFGGGEADRLYGDAGDDLLVGGLGRDTLKGGSGADIFEFRNTADSGVGSDKRDFVEDYQQGVDVLRFYEPTTGAVTFIGKGGFTGQGSNEARYLHKDGRTIVQIDFNEDKAADFEIELKGTITLTAADFALSVPG